MRIPAAIFMLLACLSAKASTMGEAREYRALRTATPPRIDGVPDEPVWKLAPEIADFAQQEPDTGSAPTERTVVRVLYDDAAIYVAAWMHDAHPVTSKLARRDSFLSADWFAVYLDTHHDHRSAAMFRVNPAGVQRDAQVIESDDEDRSWDAVWDSAAVIGPGGWTAEMRIPYSQLRFPDRPHHVWGINFHREISRNNEYTRLVHVPRNESAFVARFAHLTGIEDIEPPRRLELLPYGVARTRVEASRAPDDPFANDGAIEIDGGLDAEYGLGSNLTLSLTLNPDFGQVEADPAELNLTEFELFFPERRPFFLEGAELFAFEGIDLLYSRRIGRAPQGSLSNAEFEDLPEQTTILGALKLTGRTAGGWRVGVLDAVTREESAQFRAGGSEQSVTVEPAANYFAGRLSRDLGQSGRVGMMLTRVRRDVPSHLPLHDSAYSGGIDGVHYFGNRDYRLVWSAFGSRVSGSRGTIARTQRSPVRYFQRPDADHLRFDPERTSLSGYGGLLFFEKRTGQWRYIGRVAGFSPGLEINDIGFKTTVDTLTVTANGAYVDPTPRGRIRHRDAGLTYVAQTSFGGEKKLERILATGAVQFSNYWEFSSVLRYEGSYFDDRATRGGPLVKTPWSTSLEVSIESDRRRPVVAELQLEAGEGELGAYEREIALELTYRPRTNLTVGVEPAFVRALTPRQYVRTVADPLASKTYGMRFVFAPIERTELDLTTRVDWAPSRNLTLQLFVQPFIASGDYAGFRELDRPASLDYASYGIDRGTVAYDAAANRYTIDPDGGGASQPFSLSNPDFNVRSLRGNAVVRWEFRPGSALYVVWSQNRSGRADLGSFDTGRDLDALAGLPADDVFLVKLSYWLGL